MNEDQWYHTVCSFESGVEYKIYINGNLSSTVGSRDTTITIATTGYIGKRQNIGNDLFEGEISNAKLYNRVLSDAEVKQNFNAVRGRYGI